MKYKKCGLVLVLLMSFTSFITALTVKVGSPFPEGSPWDQELKKMAARIAEFSSGELRLRIYPGGIAGGEGDMIRKMRIGQIDMAILTSFGAKIILPESFLLSLPGLARDTKEVDYLLNNVVRRYDEKFLKAGFKNLAWSRAGWAYFFSKNSVMTPWVLQTMKLSVSSTDDEVAAIFKGLRFNVVPLSVSELMVSLQSGLVEAFYAPPMVSAAFQWFALAPHMMDFKVAPVFAITVMSQRTWNRIPSKYQDLFQEIIRDINVNFSQESESLNNEAMQVMVDNGLILNRISDEQREEWLKIFERGSQMVVGDGKWISSQSYEMLYEELSSFRGGE